MFVKIFFENISSFTNMCFCKINFVRIGDRYSEHRFPPKETVNFQW